ncbi:hypothetical protein Gotur_027162 [Gossypium turneri]
MSTKLMKAADDGDIDALYELIAEDLHALDYSDSQPCVLTPLHIAVKKGKYQFCLRDHEALPISFQEARPKWVRRSPDLVRLKGRQCLTSLHVVAAFFDEIEHNLLREFLAVSPLSITDTTNRGQTALHLAVNNGNLPALNVLLSFLRRSMYRNARYWEHKVINWKDEHGDTVLHVAAQKNDIEMI